MPWDLNHPLAVFDEIVVFLAADILPAFLFKTHHDLPPVILKLRHRALTMRKYIRNFST
jgi:hypothetical protein